MHLRQSGFTCRAGGSFVKNKERTQKFNGTGDLWYIDKACFQHYMPYGGFKDLTRRTASNKLLRNRAFNFAKSLKYHGYQRRLTSMVFKFFIRNFQGEQSKMKIFLTKN